MQHQVNLLPSDPHSTVHYGVVRPFGLLMALLLAVVMQVLIREIVIHIA